MQTKDNVVLLIEHSISLVHLKKNDGKWLLSLDSNTIKILEIILNDLEKMKTVLDPKAYMPVYPRLIVEYWDELSDIGNELLKASQSYEKLQ